MKLSEFDYNLPKELIAQFPLEKREASRLLVIKRESQKISHETFPNIIDYLSTGDTVVFNDTKVIPARLFGFREKTGGKQEVFLLEKIKDNIFKAVLNPGRGLNSGDKIIFDKGSLSALLSGRDEEGFRLLRFECNGDLQTELNKLGEIPLPPYIKRRPMDLDKQRYQTVYAKREGAVACPTAGLHFSKNLLQQIFRKGINIAYVTLHVNYATFKPVKEENIEEHKMYKEYYDFPEETTRVIAETKAKGKKIIAVGTTSCRVLETVANLVLPLTAHQKPQTITVSASSGWTDLFIHPSYDFKLTDMLLTNFHFPKSTLLMLISAFCGSDIWKKAYHQAIQEKYRFYSYGDAMLIV
jgi:S-adenosylmethionine:tRNA ribosyltransferase-isomerase